MDRGQKIYSAAYIMPSGGSLGHERKHRNHLTLIERMIEGDLPARLADAGSMQQAFDLIRGYPTIGDFLAYQYVTDVNYSTVTDFTEMEFVVPGPGAIDGIRKCFSDTGGMSDADVIRVMAERQEAEFERLGLDFPTLWGRRLQLIDCQNLFCEVDKYARVVHPEASGASGRTRIKQKFRPHPDPIDYWYPPKWGINDAVARHPVRASSSDHAVRGRTGGDDGPSHLSGAGEKDGPQPRHGRAGADDPARRAGQRDGRAAGRVQEVPPRRRVPQAVQGAAGRGGGRPALVRRQRGHQVRPGPRPGGRAEPGQVRGPLGRPAGPRAVRRGLPRRTSGSRGSSPIDFLTYHDEDDSPKVRVMYKGKQFGDDLTDNAHVKDGYGYHDVIHLAFAAVLGWSPLVRKMLKVKRKSDPKVDQVEDGGRAIATEEGLSAMIFAYARDYNFFEGKSSVSTELLRMIKNMVRHLEVSACSPGEWEHAIIEGFKVWREVKKRRGGTVDVDLDKRCISLRDA